MNRLNNATANLFNSHAGQSRHHSRSQSKADPINTKSPRQCRQPGYLMNRGDDPGEECRPHRLPSAATFTVVARK